MISSGLADGIELDDRQIGDDVSDHVNVPCRRAVQRVEFGRLPEPSALQERDRVGVIEEHGEGVLCGHV